MIHKGISYDSTDDKSVMNYIKMVRTGIPFRRFKTSFDVMPFTLAEWSEYIHLSVRSLQRIKKENKLFNSTQSEKILQLIMLYNFGLSVFEDGEALDTWLESENVSLGNVKPKALLDNHFGIDLVKDTLTRIEHGVLA